MSFSRSTTHLCCRAFAVVLTLARVAPGSASAKSHHHRRVSASYVRRVTRAQSSSISSALLRSTRLKRNQLTAEGLCDRPSKGQATCNLEVLAIRGDASVRSPARAATAHRADARDAAWAAPADERRSRRRPGVDRGADGHGARRAWLQQAYDTTWLSANAGTGDTVAIVDAYDDATAASDLATYRSNSGLPACSEGSGCFTIVNQSGQTQSHASSWPSANSDWNLETSMDLDAVSAMCPNCRIVLVEANSDGWSDLVTAEGTAANYPGVDQVSDSYGA